MKVDKLNGKVKTPNSTNVDKWVCRHVQVVEYQSPSTKRKVKMEFEDQLSPMPFTKNSSNRIPGHLESHDVEMKSQAGAPPRFSGFSSSERQFLNSELENSPQHIDPN